MFIKNKKRNCIIVFFMAAILTIGMFTVQLKTYGQNASINNYAINDIEQYIDSIISWKQESADAKSADELINKGLAPYAGAGTADWYVIAIKQYKPGGYNYREYISSLNKYIEEESANTDPVDLQRIALAYAAADGSTREGTGGDNGFINRTINNSTGKLGIMSYIYGLILMDIAEYNENNPENNFSRREIIENIMALRLDDGGWALTENVSDPDITAMAIQALAPYYNGSDPEIEETLSLLSERQMENGDYKSWGVGNCESTAQVIMALCSLGIDCRTDERFIKNGNSLIDALMLYAMPDGSFSHTIDSKVSNDKATVQALCALVSLWRNEKGLSTFYDLKNTENNEPSESPRQNTDTEQPGPEKPNYKLIIYITIISVAAICTVITIIKKKSKKNILIILLMMSLALSAVFFINIQTIDEYYLTHIEDIKEDSKTVFISINCETALKNGVVLDKKQYVLREGDTVFDILERSARHNKIQMDYTGSPDNPLSTVYIKGINNLYQYDHGPLSGWLYKVSGEFKNESCSEYKLNDRDVIEWVYTCDLGKDVGGYVN